jgi:NitT/TauT family transport system substrate-binding protein
MAASRFLAAKCALPVLIAALSITLAVPASADDKVLKVGTLKLIHGISAYFYEKFVPAGYTVEVYPFESPTDGKNAVITGTVDTCIHGIAAFLSGPLRASRS